MSEKYSRERVKKVIFTICGEFRRSRLLEFKVELDNRIVYGKHKDYSKYKAEKRLDCEPEKVKEVWIFRDSDNKISEVRMDLEKELVGTGGYSASSFFFNIDEKERAKK